ncbi:MAG: cytochrome c biogenesis protein ResB [Desulfamplus sp.]|nr:cytochrome c biogenesis protein ResB [Desulfamplus sp.]
MTINNNKIKSNNLFWNLFKSIKLTVVVLILLAATSVIGTLIPQNGTEQFYVQKYGEVFFKLFSSLDIFDMYNAWWFVLLLIILSINIIVCSIDKLQTTWKIIFPDKVAFNIERFRRLKHKEEFESPLNIEDIEGKYLSFIEKNFGIAVKESISIKDGGDNNGVADVAIFGEKGRWTRIGVYVVHLSILLMLIGAVIGGIWGFKAFVSIPEGETVDTAFLMDNNTPVKFGFNLKCNSFSVKFYDTGQPEEFKSNLTVIEDGKESITKDIVVNDPLRYKGLSFYQSSYGIDSAKNVLFKITSKESGMTYSQKMEFGQTIDIPESGGRFTLIEFVHGYNFRGHNLGEGFIGKFSENKSADNKLPKDNALLNNESLERDKTDKEKPIQDKENSEVEIYIPIKFPTFDKMRGGAFAFEIQDYDKKYYTGLQITKDPGVWYVYIGFIFMIIGCWITFFMSHQSICVEIRKKAERGCNIVVSGTANKNSQGMKLKVAKIAAKMQQI